MIVPKFTWDDDANGYISEPFTVEGKATAHIELSKTAPVVILKMEDDGGYANYGQTQEDDRYEINLTSKTEVTLKLASPVEVTNCNIIN